MYWVTLLIVPATITEVVAVFVESSLLIAEIATMYGVGTFTGAW